MFAFENKCKCSFLHEKNGEFLLNCVLTQHPLNCLLTVLNPPNSSKTIPAHVKQAQYKCRVSYQRFTDHTTAVALAFEEMRTSYASGREICVQKFGNAYQRKKIEKWMPHFNSTFQIQWNKMFFANDARFPFTYSRMFRDHSHHVLFETCWDSHVFLHTLYASLPILWTARFFVYYTQKFVLTQPLTPSTFQYYMYCTSNNNYDHFYLAIHTSCWIAISMISLKQRFFPSFLWRKQTDCHHVDQVSIYTVQPLSAQSNHYLPTKRLYTITQIYITSALPSSLNTFMFHTYIFLTYLMVCVP